MFDNPHGSDLLAAQLEHAEEGSGDEDGDEDEDCSADLDDDQAAEFRPVGDDDAEVAEVSDPDTSTSTNNDPNMARKPPVPRSAMPSWLGNEYMTMRERLTKEMAASGQQPGLPICYSQGSFYTSSSPYLHSRSVFQIGPGVFHQPQFFVWLPHCLLGDRIPCPSCKAAGRKSSKGKTVFLQRLGWVERPRHVVDVDKCIYIIGYRYRCGQELCSKTYRSWSPAILDVLPKSLAIQFVFRLTYRSGVTNALAGLLREAFRCGMGPQSFTSMVQSLHYRRYDDLHLQYLEMLCDRKLGNMANFFEKVAPFGAFGDRDGYAGFVPSPPYFRMLYDTLIEGWSREMVQRMAMLPARRLAIDESFKVNSLTDSSLIPYTNELLGYSTHRQNSRGLGIRLTPVYHQRNG